MLLPLLLNTRMLGTTTGNVQRPRRERLDQDAREDEERLAIIKALMPIIERDRG